MLVCLYACVRVCMCAIELFVHPIGYVPLTRYSCLRAQTGQRLTRDPERGRGKRYTEHLQSSNFGVGGKGEGKLIEKIRTGSSWSPTRDLQY